MKYVNGNSCWLILAFLLPMASCQSAAEKAVIGLWSVDSVAFRGGNIRPCFLSNGLDFEDDKTCLVMSSSGDCPSLGAITPYATWQVDEENMVLIINSKNRFFDKKYHLNFLNDTSQQMLVMRLASATDTIICRKGLYFYDAKQVNELVRLNIK